MSSFTSPLIVTPLKNGRDWQLVQRFSYHVGSKHSRTVIKVPVGFITDFASTDILQRLAIVLIFLYSGLMWFLPHWAGFIFLAIILLALLITPYGKQSKGAVLHDFLYRSKIFSRDYADLVFREAMIVEITPAWKANLMYYGVHWFGWLAWKTKRLNTL